MKDLTQRQPTRKELLKMLLTFLLVLIAVLAALIGVAGCSDNPASVKQVVQSAPESNILILWHDSNNVSQRYEGPFNNMQYGFEHVFLYRDGYSELQIPIGKVLSINIEK